MDKTKIEEIKKITEDLLNKMTIRGFKVEASIDLISTEGEKSENVLVNIKLADPKFLIGQEGKNLIDFQKILRLIISKKLQSPAYLRLDVNGYQRQKIEYLKDMARRMADEVVLYKKEKSLPVMSSFNRRIIHEELSKRQDVLTQSQGEGENRYITILPKNF
ncbi:MAG: hypothetical protein FJZ43_04010 [Candidatus Staskawiczbacteria bacterium]|nr:hypothetical protein [Candidatus Staskawiczbacteria bacterium]